MLTIKNLTKKFKNKTVFDHFNLDVQAGELLAITGPSGSGKSTLLNILGLIENFDHGDYALFGKHNVKPNSQLAQQLIRDKISYLFQNFALIEEETVEANLLLAVRYLKADQKTKKATISAALKRVGLAGYEKSHIFELSGGQQQRIAVARAIIKPSELILADEPTGSLDLKNRDEIMTLLKELNQQGKTIIVVTHDQEVADQCQREVYLNMPV